MLISAWEIIVRTVKLYRDNGKLFVTYSGLMILPFLIMAIGLMAAGLRGAFTGTVSGLDLAGLGAGAWMVVVVGIVALFLYFWIMAALLRVIAARYAGQTVGSIGAELKEAQSAIVPMFLTSLLVGLIAIGGFILFIIPGIIFGVWYYFSMYAAVLDKQRPVAAIKESKQLVAGRWFAVAWRIFASGLAIAILSWLIRVVVSLPFHWSADNGVVSSIGALINVVVNFFVIPLSITAPTIIFLELKKNPVASPMPTPPMPSTR